MSLPKCKLCGAPPDSADHDHGTIVWCSAVPEDKPCVLGGRMMAEDYWRILMSQTVVTDAMVERAARDMHRQDVKYRRITITEWSNMSATLKAFYANDARAVLEAALKE